MQKLRRARANAPGNTQGFLKVVFLDLGDLSFEIDSFFGYFDALLMAGRKPTHRIREVLDFNQAAPLITDGHRALDGVFELAHVSGP